MVAEEVGHIWQSLLEGILVTLCGGIWVDDLSLILDANNNQLPIYSLSLCRTDEEEHSGSKYTRMDDDSIQDKERFAR